ncbi:ABC transporter transmembrane region 2-domain-containing protein [Pisolithus sp. B1]|nr:ABC transporter transmembrane region 2-domain-containing protein [Pisolithus sp. B1]
MAILSNFGPSRERLVRLTRAYSAHRPIIQRGLMTSFVLFVLLAAYRGVAARPSPGRRGGVESSDGKVTRVAVDATFYQRLKVILRIVIPSIRTKEALLLCMHSTLLVFRTAISLYVAALDGKIVASLVRGQSFEFLLNIIRWLLVAVPATWTNSWLSYVQNKLTIAYRTRLTNEVLKQYLGEEAEGPEGKCYYKLSNLDDRIKVPDQMITYDIQRFSAHLAAIYANLAKPTLDVILYNYQLAQNVGAEGLVILTVLIQASSTLLRVLSPSFGTYTAQSAALAGNLRHGHSRLVEFAEEIAFFGGQETERESLEREYLALVRHEEEVMNKRWWYACAEEGIIKWLWGSFGVNAVGRVMYSYKDLAELAGYTSRVFLILDAISDVRTGKFQKASTNGTTIGDNGAILRGRGQVFLSEDIQFENVPIVTPNGDVLLQSLTFNVKPGENLLIVGPNGSGKSSLFRILGGLWPLPDFLLIPQRPYLSLGTFRDQVIYPHSEEQMRERGVSDADLLSVLAVVQMDGIVEREGWNVTREWRETLSGGDQQKLAWARLFYHRPKYAILDEATSLVPPDVEGRMMEHATTLGITLLTVSHRLMWMKHLALQEEKLELEAKLMEVPKMKARLVELRLLVEAQRAKVQ